jgi:peptide/nickel transport system permease protein
MSATTPLTTAATAMPPSSQVRSERSMARRERWRLLRRRPGFIIGCIVLLFWIVCAVGGERVSPYGPLQTGLPPSQAPSGSHPFGTDQLGRDVLSRVMAGARDVLLVSPLAALLSVIVGTMLGLIGGYIRGVADDIISRVMEAVLAIPAILMGLLVFTTFGTSRTVKIITIAFLFTPIVFRTVRSVTLAEAELDYVTSARLRGERSLYIMTREVVPNITGPIVVELTVRVGYAIFTLATLVFVAGAGRPEEPDWGNQVNQTYGLIQGGTWWPAIFPALAIASLVIAINLIADSLETVYSS